MKKPKASYVVAFVVALAATVVTGIAISGAQTAPEEPQRFTGPTNGPGYAPQVDQRGLNQAQVSQWCADQGFVPGLSKDLSTFDRDVRTRCAFIVEGSQPPLADAQVQAQPAAPVSVPTPAPVAAQVPVQPQVVTPTQGSKSWPPASAMMPTPKAPTVVTQPSRPKKEDKQESSDSDSSNDDPDDGGRDEWKSDSSSDSGSDSKSKSKKDKKRKAWKG